MPQTNMFQQNKVTKTLSQFGCLKLVELAQISWIDDNPLGAPLSDNQATCQGCHRDRCQ